MTVTMVAQGVLRPDGWIELLGDAAQLLHRAGRSKQPAQLILIATEERTSANLFDDLPADVTIINSTAKEVLRQIAEAQEMILTRPLASCRSATR